MKIKVYLFLSLLWGIVSVYAQDGFHYKALLTDGGTPMDTQSVRIRFDIIDDASSVVYSEYHDTTTDTHGIVNVVVGEGTVLGGNFADLDWSESYFLKVLISTDGGTTYNDFGTQELKWVPYAKYASDGGSVQGLNDLTDAKSDNDGTDDGSSIFIGIGAGQNDDGTDNRNVGVGFESLNNETDGFGNTSIGYKSLHQNTTGFHNVAIGNETLYRNTDRSNLVAIGDSALFNNGQNVTETYHATENTAVGSKVLLENTTGYRNTGLGDHALYNNTEGNKNTAIGRYSMADNTTGSINTAVGMGSLQRNTTGNSNTALGVDALFSNTIGDYNVAVGRTALAYNTTGYSNIAIGTYALYRNTVRHNLVAIGDSALYNNGQGATSNNHATNNTAVGSKTLYNNTIGYYNTALGTRCLMNNTTGSLNTALGAYALGENTTGDWNTSVGHSSLFNNTTGRYNTAIGKSALYNNTTGESNTALGYQAFYNGTGYHNSTALGHYADITASNQVRIGNNFVTSIGGYANWTNISDARFKKDIRENVKGLEFILKLRPVTYRLDMEAIAKFRHTPGSLRLKESESRKGQMLQTGFIAQEVEQVAQSVGYDFSGVDAPKNNEDYYGLRYAEFVVPLVKATQEQQEVINQLKERIQELENENKELKQLKTEIENLKQIINKTLKTN